MPIGLCISLPALSVREAVIIAYLESSIARIVSKSGDDLGIWQVHKNTVKRFGLDPKLIVFDIDYQVVFFSLFMEHKKQMCKAKSVPALCWHSATPKFYEAYKVRYMKALRKLEK